MRNSISRGCLMRLLTLIAFPMNLISNLIAIRSIHIKYVLLMIRFPSVVIYRHKSDYEQCSITSKIMKTGFIMSSIYMDTTLTRKKFDTALLHELGHHIDFKERRGRNGTTNREKTAWKEAIKLSDKHEIPICYTTAKQWLKSYNANSAFLNKRI